MFEMLAVCPETPFMLASIAGLLSSTGNILLILLGFSVVIFFHELGHFAVAKWAGIRVEKFAIGFGTELLGFTRGETRYSLNLLPLGGYVKMLGQEDFEVDKSGELTVRDDPRSFTNKPVGQRMAVVSAGVIMNLIVAAVLFMIVFMVGKVETAPLIGQVLPDSPAAKAGLQAGDRIVSINDFEIDNFDQISTAVRLAEPYVPLVFVVEREGRLEVEQIVPETSDMNWLQVGIAPSWTNQIVYVSGEYAGEEGAFPMPGDIIVEINGQEIDESMQLYVWASLLAGRNRASTMVVERPAAHDPDGPKERVTISIDKNVGFARNGAARDAPRDLLGLAPRVQVTEIRSKSPAAYAGLVDGDIIVRWGNEMHPTAKSILSSLKDKEGKDIPVTVRRDGELLDQPLYYRPEFVQSKGGEREPVVRCKMQLNEQDLIILADVASEAFGRPTPASATDLHKGCQITALNGQPLGGWAELVERFRELAGTAVEITYLPPESTTQSTTTMSIPESISTKLNLPSYAGPFQRIKFALDGKTEVAVSINDKEEFLPSYHPLAIRQYLEQHVGQEVQVTYQDETGDLREGTLQVTADMIDPWYRRVVYSIPQFHTNPVTYLNQQLNPLTAIWAGTMQTYYFVAKTYLTLRRLIFDRTVGVEHMSGPVGIVRIGSRIAKASKIEMLFFLALISANLAVLNFLPLPIVDGGLMVFLIIEKIKGSPVGLRTQVVTQLIGIALFATMFVLITFKDIADWVG